MSVVIQCLSAIFPVEVFEEFTKRSWSKYCIALQECREESPDTLKQVTSNGC